MEIKKFEFHSKILMPLEISRNFETNFYSPNFKFMFLNFKIFVKKSTFLDPFLLQLSSLKLFYLLK